MALRSTAVQAYGEHRKRQIGPLAGRSCSPIQRFIWQEVGVEETYESYIFNGISV